MSPCQVAHIRGHAIHFMLQLFIVFVATIFRQLVYELNSPDELVTMPSCNVNSLFNSQFLWDLWGTGRPSGSVFFPKQPEFEGTATSYASKPGRQLLIILEFQPIDKAISVAMA